MNLGKAKECLVRCEYGSGMFSNEYAVGFKTDGKKWYFVNRTDVMPTGEKEALIRALLLTEEDDRYLVAINDVGDYRLSWFYVPKVDVLRRG